MMNNIKSIILDTGFLINLYSDKFALQNHCKEYYRYFLENKIDMYVSTISLAEYCVGSSLSDIELDKFRIIPFNIQHCPIAGKFAKHCIHDRDKFLHDIDRKVVMNDIKILSQAAFHKIDALITKDVKLEKIINRISSLPESELSIKYLNISRPYTDYFATELTIQFD